MEACSVSNSTKVKHMWFYSKNLKLCTHGSSGRYLFIWMILKKALLYNFGVLCHNRSATSRHCTDILFR